MGVWPNFITPGRRASGGGGGLDPKDINYEDIDLTDGSWTLYDPDSTISLIQSGGSGWHMATWNTVAANAVYNWANSSTKKQPRWYKPLVLNGTAVTNSHIVSLQTAVQIDDGVDDFGQAVFFGMIDGAGNSTSVADLVPTGAYATKQTSGLPYYGNLEYTGASTGVHADIVQVVTSQLRGGGGGGSGTYIGVDASGLMKKQGSRNSNRTISGDLQQYLCVGLGTVTNAISVTSGDRQKFRVRFRAMIMNPGAA